VLNRHQGLSSPLSVDPGPGPQPIPPKEPKVKKLFVKRWDLNGNHLLLDAHNIREAVQCEDGTWHYEMLDGEIIGPLLWERPVTNDERIAEAAEMMLNAQGKKSARQIAAEKQREVDQKMAMHRLRWEAERRAYKSERDYRSRIGRFPL
jgi:hypothetical protein